MRFRDSCAESAAGGTPPNANASPSESAFTETLPVESTDTGRDLRRDGRITSTAAKTRLPAASKPTVVARACESAELIPSPQC